MCIKPEEWQDLTQKVGTVQKKQDICFAVTEEKFNKLHHDIHKLQERFKVFDEMPSKIYAILTKFLAGALSIGLIVFGGIFFWINQNYKHYTSDILDLKTSKITYEIEMQQKKIVELETKFDRLDYRLRNTTRIINKEIKESEPIN